MAKEVWGGDPYLGAVLEEAWHDVGGGSSRLDDEEMRRRRSPICIERGSNVDGTEGPGKGETEAGSRCVALKRS